MSDNPLLADVESTRTATTGLWPIEDAKGVVTAIEPGDWVSGGLAVTGAALSAASMVMDPIGSLLSAGIGWAMEYFEPLRQILDDLTGKPDLVTSHARTWTNVAGAMADFGMQLDAAVQAVRDTVRDLIADLVARVIVWVAEAIFVVTLPLIASQIAAAVVRWIGIITGLVDALVNSLQDLMTLVRG